MHPPTQKAPNPLSKPTLGPKKSLERNKSKSETCDDKRGITQTLKIADANTETGHKETETSTEQERERQTKKQWLPWLTQQAPPITTRITTKLTEVSPLPIS